MDAFNALHNISAYLDMVANMGFMTMEEAKILQESEKVIEKALKEWEEMK